MIISSYILSTPIFHSVVAMYVIVAFNESEFEDICSFVKAPSTFMVIFFTRLCPYMENDDAGGGAV